LAAEPQTSLHGGISSSLEPGRGWERIRGGFQLTADSAVDEAGIVYFTGARKNRIWKIDSDGRSLFGRKTAEALTESPLGLMGGCTQGSTIV
ncbi:MAG: gluconolactonase, partial [Bryobacterales bacterium]|nr:gluconolactonase [Bryobacterales bacterium]